MKPLNLEEAGCVVCGELKPVGMLSCLKGIKNFLSVIEAQGVTQFEKNSMACPMVCTKPLMLTDVVLYCAPPFLGGIAGIQAESTRLVGILWEYFLGESPPKFHLDWE